MPVRKKTKLVGKIQSASIQNASLRHLPHTDLEEFRLLIDEWHSQHRRSSLAVTMSGI